MKTQAYGWCCSDCLFWLANGDTPVEMDEDQTAAWLAEIDRNLGDWHVGLGGEHEEGCPNIAQGTGAVTNERTGRIIYRTGDESLGEAIASLSPNTSYDAPSRAGAWLGTTDCYCEQIDFSWSSCDVCGSGLGGSRDAVFFWTEGEKE